MPLPLAPLAPIALRYGTVAVAAWALARRVERGRRDQRAEDALDDLPEGTTLRREAGQTSATSRWRRVIRAGRTGLEIDIAALGRVRIRRLGRWG